MDKGTNKGQYSTSKGQYKALIKDSTNKGQYKEKRQVRTDILRIKNKKEGKMHKKTKQNYTNKQDPLHHLKRERVVDNGESRRIYFPSREILRAFGRDDKSIQLERSPNAGPKDGLGWRSCQQPCHT